MPRPKKIKSPEDFGKEFEKLKKPRKPKEPKELMNKKEMAEKIEELNADRAVANIVCHNTNVPAPLEELREYVEKCEKYPLENLQKLEKKLRDCTTENPTVITYGFTGDKTSLYMEFLNHIKVVADISSIKMFCLESMKTYLATAHKMHEVLKEWRGE